MRRILTTLSLTISVFVLTALPAFAAEEAAADDEINGVLLALIIGTVVGLALFVDAYARGSGSDDQPSDAAEH